MKIIDHDHRRDPGPLNRRIYGAIAPAPIRWARNIVFAAAALTAGASVYAQTVIGSPGAGFQTWTPANLNNNGMPFWDAVTKGYVGPATTSKNVGFCMTSSGDCVGIMSPAFAPGALAYWGMPFDSAHDSGGAMDPKVYFHHSHAEHTLKATLELQLTTAAGEINDIGWFETDATGSTVGAKHLLFHGAGGGTPDPIGKTVDFKPTPYFGYYFSDFSEGGCLAYTLSAFNDLPNCSAHDFVVFSKEPGHPRSTFWIAGIDPPGCGDGDCNLTLIKVSPDER